jgi:hypothetical protein
MTSLQIRKSFADFCNQANLTRLHQAITNTLEDHIAKTVDPTKSDYAVIVGVQIHAGVKSGVWTPDSFLDYFAPGLCHFSPL